MKLGTEPDDVLATSSMWVMTSSVSDVTGGVVGTCLVGGESPTPIENLTSLGCGDADVIGCSWNIKKTL